MIQHLMPCKSTISGFRGRRLQTAGYRTPIGGVAPLAPSVVGVFGEEGGTVTDFGAGYGGLIFQRTNIKIQGLTRSLLDRRAVPHFPESIQ